MKTSVKYILVIITLLSLGAVGYGFFIQSEDPVLANKIIGFGTVGLFLIAMPIFLIVNSQGKKVKDYMLTDENIRKMRNREEKEGEDQK